MFGAVSGLVGAAVAHAYDGVLTGDVRSLGQFENVVQTFVSTFLEKYGPEIGQQLMVIAEPAARKAAAIVKPAVVEALEERVPQFAGILGVAIGLAILGGVWLAKEVPKRRKLW